MDGSGRAELLFEQTVASMRFFVEPCVYQPCEAAYAGRTEMKESRILAFIDELSAQIQKARPEGTDGELICAEMTNGLRMVRAATRLRAHILGLDDGAGLMQEIELLCSVHKQLWTKRNRVSGLSASLENFQAVLQGLKQEKKS